MYKICLLLAVVGITLAAPKKSFISPGHVTLSNNVGIVGGSETDISKHPWQVSVQQEFKHFCGGVLISPDWVVSACHCFSEGFTTNLNIRAASTQRESGGQTALVQDLIVHPNFSNETFENDVCLLRLGTAITKAPAKAATLPPAGADVPNGATLLVSGWGDTVEGGEYSDVLREVTVPTIDRTKCDNIDDMGKVTENMFCAGFDEGGKDSCQGDSGGPASINGVVVGLVSWGNGCAEAGFPGVYVRLSNYRSYITQITGV